MAWGETGKATESDILRFQWPSIVSGWELGLISFARSRIAGVCSYSGGEIKLLTDVMGLPNTNITIIHGTKDAVLPFESSKRIVEKNSNHHEVKLIAVDGCGHDPMEEDVDKFVKILEDNIPSSQ